MRSTLRTLAALAMVALITAGCSNAPAETGTGSNGGKITAATHEQAVLFAECMRDNGVREFPDPDASGEFAYGIERGSSLDPSTAASQTATASSLERVRADRSRPGLEPTLLELGKWGSQFVPQSRKERRC